jgi:hypothetical protein
MILGVFAMYVEEVVGGKSCSVQEKDRMWFDQGIV